MPETDHVLDVYFGEAVTSVRQALKRYSYHTTFGPRSESARLFTRRQFNLPFYRGYSLNGIHTTLEGQPYNYCNTTVLNWYIPAYAGWRGATRWKYVCSFSTPGEGETDQIPGSVSNVAMSVTRDANLLGYSETTSNALINTSPSQFARQGIITQRTTFSGTTMTYKQGNNTVEVELPWYSNQRFAPAKTGDFTSNDVKQVHTFQSRSDLRNGLEQYDAFCSIGEDFQLVFFLGAPRFFYRPGEPQPLP
jgi:hypothetical protein